MSSAVRLGNSLEVLLTGSRQRLVHAQGSVLALLAAQSYTHWTLAYMQKVQALKVTSLRVCIKLYVDGKSLKIMCFC